MGKARSKTRTGGREATLRHIAGDTTLAVCMPPDPDPPSGWTWVALTDVAQMESGHTPSRRHSEYWDGEIPWIGIKDAKANHGCEISDTNDHVTQSGLDNSSARLLPPRTVCLSRTASVGYVTIMGRPMATSQDFVNWICGDELLPKYLMHLFIGENKALLRFASGAVHQTIYYPEAKAMYICFPPLPEQERIVAILDEAFAAIATATANAEKNLANARELFESELNRQLTGGGSGDAVMGGWVKKSLGEVCEIESKLVDPRESDYIDMPHVGAGNIVSDTGNIIDLKTAREEGLRSGKFVFDDQMILYSKIRPYLRKVCRPSFSGLCSADIYPLLPREGHSRDFLFYMLLSEHFTDYAKAGSARAGMPKVNRPHLFAYRRSFPSLPEQERIVAILDEVSESTTTLSDIAKQKLTHLSNLKQSLLHKAFTGELTADKTTADRTLSEAGV